jgi:dihydroneopterin aldolase
MLKKIVLENINLKCFAGCLPKEREQKTSLSFNVELHMDLKISPLVEDDDLKNTIDYREIMQTIINTSNKRHYAIIENLGENIVVNLYKLSKNIKSITLEISKPGALGDDIIPKVEIVYP